VHRNLGGESGAVCDWWAGIDAEQHAVDGATHVDFFRTHNAAEAS
jgi:hypothetical protein